MYIPQIDKSAATSQSSGTDQAITVFSARRIHTMNPGLPEGSHVAVRDGRVLAVGDAGLLEAFPGARLDDRFADKVLLPGFVEGHCHIMEGAIWAHTYVGRFGRLSPDGEACPGLDSIEAVVERLRGVEQAMDTPGKELFAWGFDPIYFGGRRMTRLDLDRVSTTRPVLVFHSSLHIVNVNGYTLDFLGVTRDTGIDAVLKGPDGEPTGELRGVVFRLRLLFPSLNWHAWDNLVSPAVVERFARSATNAGITTIADLHNDLRDATVELYSQVTARPGFPVRMATAMSRFGLETDAAAKKVEDLKTRNTDHLRHGIAKIIADGSIQAFTARLRWPGFHNGAAPGLWYVAPDELKDIVARLHAARVQMHIHTNGDEAIESALDAIDAAQSTDFWPDHRHTLQHCQTATPAQFRRMKALGVCVNLFASHIYFWGDQHRAVTLGPERAARMDAVASAMNAGLTVAIHSDAPVTPLGPLFCAWAAVNRRTATGKLLGPAERVGVLQALEAVTIGPAATLKMDHLVGSIETGKFADFAVLDDDPLAVDPADLKDIGVWGTVCGGQAFPARKSS